jgi:3-oxoacyl-[acyl-carrier-protein] synthase II
VSSACTSSALSIGAALDALRAGEIDVAIAGGSDSFCRLTHAGFNSLRSIDPEVAKPFGRDRAGLTLGEGAGIVVLESAAHAAARGARPLAWLAGFGSTCDAHHMTAPEPSGKGAGRAIAAALADAGLAADDVAFLNAHATATPLNDAAEWAAFAATFGDRATTIPVLCPKGAIGHLLGAAGGIEAALTVACLARQCIPPIALEPLDPALPAAVVQGTPRRPAGAVGVSTNLAFGGSNTALVFTSSVVAGSEVAA